MDNLDFHFGLGWGALNGFEEYKSIAGTFGVFIYHIMFLITSTISSFIKTFGAGLFRNRHGSVWRSNVMNMNISILSNNAKTIKMQKKLNYQGINGMTKHTFVILDILEDSAHYLRLNFLQKIHPLKHIINLVSWVFFHPKHKSLSKVLHFGISVLKTHQSGDVEQR